MKMVKLKETIPYKAIQLPVAIKSYWLQKFKFLIDHNGIAEAYRIFKDLRVSVISLIALEGGTVRERMKLIEFPVRKNKALKNLCEIALTNPHETILMLKMYTMSDTLSLTVDEATTQHLEMLEKANIRTEAQKNAIDQIGDRLLDITRFIMMHPRHIDYFVRLCENGRIFIRYRLSMEGGKKILLLKVYPKEGTRISMSSEEWASLVFVAKMLMKHAIYRDDRIMQRYTLPDPLLERESNVKTRRWKHYFYKLLTEFKQSLLDVRKSVTTYPAKPKEVVLPSMQDYKAYWSGNRDEAIRQLEEDYANFQSIRALGTRLGTISRIMDPDSYDVDYSYWLNRKSPLTPVGKVEAIRKKGTLEYRMIANGNRYLQNIIFSPGARFLYHVLHAFPSDCTFDQNRKDLSIYQGVQRGVAASVDLSKATDYLPYDLGMKIMQGLGEYMPHTQAYEQIVNSLQGFQAMLEGYWAYSNGSVTQWKVGQPLGTLPSFAILGLTQNLLAMYASLMSPGDPNPSKHNYAILGDDVVLMNKSEDILMSFYERMGCPISYHKSYKGRVAEFAGKLYIRNNGYRYSTDLIEVEVSSLLDWQASTKVPIPYSMVSGKLSRRFPKLGKDLEHAYLALQIYSGVYDDRLRSKRLRNVPEQAAEFLEVLYRPRADKLESLPSLVGNRVISEGSVRYQGDRMSQLPKSDWFKRKFRPETITSLIRILEAVELEG